MSKNLEEMKISIQVISDHLTPSHSELAAMLITGMDALDVFDENFIKQLKKVF